MNGLGSGDKEIRTLDPLLAKQVLQPAELIPRELQDLDGQKRTLGSPAQS